MIKDDDKISFYFQVLQAEKEVLEEGKQFMKEGRELFAKGKEIMENPEGPCRQQ